MSTLKVNNIQTASGGSNSTPEQIESGRAKSFVTFDSRSTLTILHSFNVSSMTDNAVGDYTISFSTAHSDADYAMAGTCCTGAGNENGLIKIGPRANTNAANQPITKTVSACRLRTSSGTTEQDTGNAYLVTYD